MQISKVTPEMPPNKSKTPQWTTKPQISTLPKECKSALNFTESWRRDYSGQNIQPINGFYNCDLSRLNELGNPWFRFSGEAGTHLLTSCPATNGT